MPSVVKKYSIKDVDVLITSINSLSGETEEAICKALGYNEGYIAQLRSREKSDEVPRVSPKFYNILSDYRDKAQQKANKMQGAPAETGATPDLPTLLSQLMQKQNQLMEMQNKILAEQKEDLIDKVKEIHVNSKSTIAYLQTILRVNRADDAVIMDNQDVQAGREVGSSAMQAGNLEIAAAQDQVKKDKKQKHGAHK
jgi:hypothetical protein